MQATPDLLMGDPLKEMRSSQVFNVCALPDVEVRAVAADEPERFQVRLLEVAIEGYGRLEAPLFERLATELLEGGRG